VKEHPLIWWLVLLACAAVQPIGFFLGVIWVVYGALLLLEKLSNSREMEMYRRSILSKPTGHSSVGFTDDQLDYLANEGVDVNATEPRCD
jgi:hypothetical protein